MTDDACALPVGELLPRESSLSSDNVQWTQVRHLVQQTQAMINLVKNERDAVLLVRRASATEKLLAQMLKASAAMEDEQFELRQAAAEAHLRTQRRAGELLAELEKHPGGRPSKAHVKPDQPPSLRQLGIGVHESHRWQRIASLPSDQFERYLAECLDKRRELTVAGALLLARQLAREQQEADDEVKLSDGPSLLAEYDKARSHLTDLIWLDPTTLALAVDPTRRMPLIGELTRFRLWMDEVIQALTA